MSRTSRRKREQLTKNRETPVVAPSRRLGITRITVGIVTAVAVAAAVIVIIRSSRLVSKPSPRALDTTLTRYRPGPQNLKDLLTLDSAKLINLDIARVNLLCAEGLPGAERLNIEQCVAQLDRWAERVNLETDRQLYQFQRNPSDYENSEAYFRMLVLITVLQRDLGVHYDPARINDIDFTHSEDLFIHGMIPAAGQSTQQTTGGTCVSMPVIYTAIGRRLGYPVKLVHTKAHLFCRWDGMDHPREAWRKRLNIEATNQGMNSFSDEYYKTWPYQISEAEIKANRHLQSLTPAEELAEFLATRGHCLLDTGKMHEALDAYNQAVKLCPSNALLASFQLDVLRRLTPTDAERDIDLMSRPNLRPADRLAEVERINAMNRMNMERMKRAALAAMPQSARSQGSGVSRP